jgi:FO synthase
MNGPLPMLPEYTDAALRDFAAHGDTAEMCAAARAVRDVGHGVRVTYSRKVFIPLTKLCRDVCSYCTFAHPPRKGERAYLTADEVLAIARAGQAAG